MSRTLPSSAVLQLASTDAYCWLISIEYSDETTGDAKYLRYASNPVPILFTPSITQYTFEPAPFTIDPLKETGDASNFEEWKLNMPDPAGLVKSWVRQNETLNGRVATMYLIRVPDGAAPTAAAADTVLSQPFLVKEVVMEGSGVMWVLGPRNFLSHTFPGRRCFRSRCGHIFRGTRCAYADEDLTCDYTYAGPNGCVGKGNEDNFGGFLHIPHGNER